MMSDEQREEAERILSYYETHGTLYVLIPDAVALLRDLLPEWSAFKDES